MARAIESDQVTAADELRALLAESEKLVTSKQSSCNGALQLLANMDRIAALWAELEAAGMDLRAEAGRWMALQATVHEHASAIARRFAGVGGLRSVRAARGSGRSDPHPTMAGLSGRSCLPGSGTQEAWWWNLDLEAQARRRRRLLRSGAFGLAAVLLALAAVALLPRLFPIDPRAAAAASDLADGQEAIEENHDYQKALADFVAATQQTPGDLEAWAWVGSVQQKLGNAAAAKAAFDRSRALSSSETDFLLAQSAGFAGLNMNGPAQADLDAVLKADPQNARAYFYLASVEQNEGQMQAAETTLAKASSLADAQNQTELAAVARYRLGMLMQQPQAQ
jgi:tetratricopeptide (TPR) repeat protein